MNRMRVPLLAIALLGVILVLGSAAQAQPRPPARDVGLLVNYEFAEKTAHKKASFAPLRIDAQVVEGFLDSVAGSDSTECEGEPCVFVDMLVMEMPRVGEVKKAKYRLIVTQDPGFGPAVLVDKKIKLKKGVAFFNVGIAVSLLNGSDLSFEVRPLRGKPYKKEMLVALTAGLSD